MFFLRDMTKNLVIVESPAKAKTIKKYLGKDFEVLASYGHVRDLVPKEGAVDPQQRFAMRYQVIDKNEKHVQAITKALKKADALYLATDPDREGEAISWHLLELLKEEGRPRRQGSASRGVLRDHAQRGSRGHPAAAQRFHRPGERPAGTPGARLPGRLQPVAAAVEESRLVRRLGWPGAEPGAAHDLRARGRDRPLRRPRVLDHRSGCGQVEPGVRHPPHRIPGHQGRTVQLHDGSPGDRGARTIEARREAAYSLVVANVDRKQRKRNPSPPFTTSTLQQEAARKLGFGAQRTMRLAQRLYEGVDFGEGPVGLITYMRTDSLNLAADAISEIRSVIGKLYGAAALPHAPRVYKTKSKNAQEAHEGRAADVGSHHARNASRARSTRTSSSSIR